MEFMAKVIKANSLYAKEFHEVKIAFFFYVILFQFFAFFFENKSIKRYFMFFDLFYIHRHWLFVKENKFYVKQIT